ncbi:MAG: glycosyl transferase [Thermobacillus sp. ZCTH02-B1]|uniref:glycosyltransferase n=1 Tax=Thermobacillus sp. ZCTH02-B1 TaxID=1858795 RepID=UPI000B55CA4A|nr:glycosyltransferase [Thermobacillus sp. ZCTH02-B1]OUM97354.1 MAG: glycosyl transferase [Thermobacillus sp. ZCTH02-B1]
MITISLCMIVRDEEAVLGRCLDSVAPHVEEIIVVDTGSTDRTKEIAGRYGAKVCDFAWIDDFAAARNFAFSKAGMDYILWLDADDYLTPEDGRRLADLKRTLDPAYNAVSMPYILSTDESGRPSFMLRRHRLVKRSCRFRWIGAVHEYLEVRGPVFHSDVCVTHDKKKPRTDRNLRIYRARQAGGEEFSPRDLYYFANELRDHGLYEEACEYYERFLDTGGGWVEDNIQACLKLAECRRQLGDERREFGALCRSFLYDRPRGECCYRIGEYFLNRGKADQAAFWFQMAVSLPVPEDAMGMRNRAMTTWMPHLQLAVCYSRLGKHERGFLHNEKAASYVPNHPSVLHNRKFYARVLGIEASAIDPSIANGRSGPSS